MLVSKLSGHFLNIILVMEATKATILLVLMLQLVEWVAICSRNLNTLLATHHFQVVSLHIITLEQFTVMIVIPHKMCKAAKTNQFQVTSLQLITTEHQVAMPRIKEAVIVVLIQEINHIGTVVDTKMQMTKKNKL